MQISEFTQVDFATWRWFRNLEMICNLIRSLEVISQRGSQLRRWSFNLRSGTRVLAGGFTAAKYLAKFHRWISFRSSFHRCKMGFGLRNFRNKRLILQLRNFRTAWCGCIQTAITSSFQLQFVHCLKCWTPDFLSFETTYGMNEMESRKYSKCVQQFLSSWILHVRFLSLLLLLAFMICFWKRTIKLQSLGSSCKWDSNFFAMDSIELSSILDCFGDQNTIKNTKT